MQLILPEEKVPSFSARARPSLKSTLKKRMQITINHQNKFFDTSESISLLQVLESENLKDQKGIAVAINNTVIPKTAWSEKFMQENDEVLIIKATQGG